MLRITEVRSTEQELILKLEGWLSAAEVDLLRRELIRCFETESHVVLDLKAVSYMDDDGIALLKSPGNGELVLHGATSFVHQLLVTHGLANPKQRQ